MPGNSRAIVAEAERRFPVRNKIAERHEVFGFIHKLPPCQMQQRMIGQVVLITGGFDKE